MLVFVARDFLGKRGGAIRRVRLVGWRPEWWPKRRFRCRVAEIGGSAGLGGLPARLLGATTVASGRAREGLLAPGSVYVRHRS